MNKLEIVLGVLLLVGLLLLVIVGLVLYIRGYFRKCPRPGCGCRIARQKKVGAVIVITCPRCKKVTHCRFAYTIQ